MGTSHPKVLAEVRSYYAYPIYEIPTQVRAWLYKRAMQRCSALTKDKEATITNDYVALMGMYAFCLYLELDVTEFIKDDGEPGTYILEYNEKKLHVQTTNYTRGYFGINSHEELEPHFGILAVINDSRDTIVLKGFIPTKAFELRCALYTPFAGGKTLKVIGTRKMYHIRQLKDVADGVESLLMLGYKKYDPSTLNIKHRHETRK